MAARKNKAEAPAKKNYLQYVVPAVIIILALITLNPVMENNILFGWDDTEYLTNEDVRELDIAGIFSDYHLGMYQPLAVVSLAINYASAGESPGAYHATNLFIHALNIFLAWLFLFRLTRKRTVAGIGALLFAIHPMNVEPVAWLSARSTLIFTSFYLGSMITYMKYTDHGKIRFYIISGVFALAALFTKSLAISIPFALLLIDHYRGRTINAKLWIDKVPFLVFAAIFGYITVDAASTYGHISELQHEYSLFDRFFILCHTYTFYLVKFLVPVNLSSIYAYPGLNGASLPALYYLSPLVPAALIFLCIRYWVKERQLITGILFFSIAIAPVLPLFWSRIFVAADRYAYLSFIGLFLLTGLVIQRLLNSDLLKKQILQYSLFSVLGLYIVFLLYMSNTQCRYWSTGETLLSRAVALSNSAPAKALSHFYRGNIYQNMAEVKYQEGQASANEGMIRNSFTYFREAVSDYDSAMHYNSEYMLAYSNRGMIYGTLVRYDEKYWNMALEDFDRAIEIDSSYADNYYNKAWLVILSGDTTSACGLWQLADDKGSVVAGDALRQYCE